MWRCTTRWARAWTGPDHTFFRGVKRDSIRRRNPSAFCAVSFLSSPQAQSGHKYLSLIFLLDGKSRGGAALWSVDAVHSGISRVIFSRGVRVFWVGPRRHVVLNETGVVIHVEACVAGRWRRGRSVPGPRWWYLFIFQRISDHNSRVTLTVRPFENDSVYSNNNNKKVVMIIYIWK